MYPVLMNAPNLESLIINVKYVFQCSKIFLSDSEITLFHSKYLTLNYNYWFKISLKLQIEMFELLLKV